jgi:hypothetical protein
MRIETSEVSRAVNMFANVNSFRLVSMRVKTVATIWGAKRLSINNIFASVRRDCLRLVVSSNIKSHRK